MIIPWFWTSFSISFDLFIFLDHNSVSIQCVNELDKSWTLGMIELSEFGTFRIEFGYDQPDQIKNKIKTISSSDHTQVIYFYLWLFILHDGN